MSKEFYDTTQNQNSPGELSYQPAYLKPKVQSKIQPKVYSKVQPKLMTDAGKQKKESSDVSTSHAKLPEEVQAKMETSFDQDFSEVNIHTSSNSAKDINAKAYTQGNDIHFAPGEYNPSTQPGQELIGHELTHVVQQKQGRVGPGEIHGKDLELNMDPSLEKEADDAGKRASTGSSVPPLSKGKSGIQFKLTGIDNSTLSEITTTGVSATVAKGDGLEAGIESSQKLAEADWSSILLYAAIFKEVGDKYGVPGALLAAIASRESRAGKGLNENGYGKYDANGYGLMQIDKNANASLTGKEGAYSKEHIETATKLFVKLFEEIKTKHPDWTLAWKLRGAVAAYNFGSDDVRTQANIDKGSTGNDYSADIWERAKYYAQKKEFAEAKNEAITNTSTAPATTTTTTTTPATTNTSSGTTTTTTNQPAAKVYVPVYHQMPEVSETLLGVVGAPGAKTYTAEVINFVSDVNLLQKLMKDLGVLSEADYELESGQAGENLFVPTNWPAPEVPAPLSAVEKKFMDVYGKIPMGPQLPASLIPKTIQAIRTYQLEVMNAKVDGSVSSKGATLASMQANTAEKVAIARKNYAIKKKQEAEALKKKKEEEAQKLAKEQEEIKKQQAYIASLKSVGDDKESVKKIYDANIYDMRVLGKEMRKYAPHNPKLVIAMLKYMNYTDSDNLAFNITSNMADAELGGLNHDLLNTLKEYLSAGWTEETEAAQIKRIDTAIGGAKPVTTQIETQATKSGYFSYQGKQSSESYVINASAHASQTDNTYTKTSAEMYGGKSNNTSTIKGSSLCNITSLCMVLCSIEPEDTVRNNVILLLKEHGKKITDEENVKMKSMQVEDLVALFFEQLGITYFIERGLYSYKNTGEWHPHQVHACLNHVGMLISKKTENISSKTANIIKKGVVVGKKDYKEYYTNEVAPHIKKGNPIYTSCYTTGGHIVSIIGVSDDGVIINDPYGSLLHERSKYLVHGRDITGMLTLAKQNLSLLEKRLKYNSKGYSEIELIINSKKGVVPTHLGERNFYDWEEVEKYDIGINLNIFEKKQ